MKTKSQMDLVTDTSSNQEEKKPLWRDLVAFWIFGLTNNFAYVVMLSAAHDVLQDGETGSSVPASNTRNATASNITNTTALPPIESDDYLLCNPISTGAILLADILPTLFIKLTFPMFLQQIPYPVKISLISGFGLCSFLIVAFAHEVWLGVIGVVFASIGAGLGEITFLSLTTFYHSNVVSMWSSGTGGAGVLGALAYAGLTTIGVSARNSLIIMVSIPVLMMLTYIFILTAPETKNAEPENIDDSTFQLEETNQKPKSLTMKEKLHIIPSLFKYMIPLTIVYFAEYFINQGLHELLYYNGLFLTSEEQYRWYQVDYQIGVFISRSSVNVFKINKLWILPILQFVNLVILILQVFYRFIPSFYIVLAIVFWEGLLGGGAYVNTFYKMTKEIPAEHKEYSIGVASLGDSIGIAVAGAVAIPTHNAICKVNIKI